jgi:hypothetical protein
LVISWFSAACCCRLDAAADAADGCAAAAPIAAVARAAAAGGGEAVVGMWVAAEAALMVEGMTGPFVIEVNIAVTFCRPHDISAANG